VWTISKNDKYRKPANNTSQENVQEEINNGICLLRCLTGHKGNIHTVAFSRAGMLVTQNTQYFITLVHVANG